MHCKCFDLQQFYSLGINTFTTTRHLLHTATVCCATACHPSHNRGPAKRDACGHVRPAHPSSPPQRCGHGNGSRHHHGHVSWWASVSVFCEDIKTFCLLIPTRTWLNLCVVLLLCQEPCWQLHHQRLLPPTKSRCQHIGPLAHRATATCPHSGEERAAWVSFQ